MGIIHQRKDFCYYHSMRRHLLFDADGTLYDFAASERYALSSLFSDLSIPYTAEWIDPYHEENDRCWSMFENGEMTMEELKGARFERFFRRTGLPFDGRKAGMDYISYLGEAGFMLPGATAFIEDITKDHEASIITNGIAYTQHRRFEKTDTEKYFSHVFVSEELGVQKPDRRFFSKVLGILGLGKDDCIVIGDSEKSDIQGALNAGIESIYISFDGKESAMADHSVHSFDELSALIRNIC